MKKAVIRICDVKTKKIIKNKKVFLNYEQAIKYIEENLNNTNNYIYIRFTSKKYLTTYGTIYYCNEEGWANLEAAKTVLKDWLNEKEEF